MNTFPRGVQNSALALRRFSWYAALVLLLAVSPPSRAGYLPLSNCKLSSQGAVEVEPPLFCASPDPVPESSIEADGSTLPRSPLIPVGPAASRSLGAFGVGASNPTGGQRRWGPSAEAILGDSRLTDLHLVHQTRSPRVAARLFPVPDSLFRPPRMPG
jgi:hypothetical protein